MRAAIVWRGWPGAPDIPQQLGFQTTGGTAGVPMFQAIDGQRRRRNYCRRRALLWWYSAGYGRLVKPMAAQNQALRQLATQRKTPLTE